MKNNMSGHAAVGVQVQVLVEDLVVLMMGWKTSSVVPIPKGSDTVMEIKHR